MQKPVEADHRISSLRCLDFCRSGAFPAPLRPLEAVSPLLDDSRSTPTETPCNATAPRRTFAGAPTATPLLDRR
ncbi:hypothetical protein EUGRSUZ_B02238 [Eucalyptus grandis]|uniref:Uncharacterized protein n=2 Tax=Eucalyptus grandis TaxID=71139 RepID=A0ACC3LSZ5_EUCGR|nr:hypothetical protein EUGRSUZ_B02238 [Eucalyptus grandis]